MRAICVSSYRELIRQWQFTLSMA